MRQRRNSGQILLIAAFIMASILLSAQFYVLEVGKNMGEVQQSSLTGFMLSVKFGSRHVVTGSLANASNAGSNSALELNLQNWASFVHHQYTLGENVLEYTLREEIPYSSGIWLQWGSSGSGVSSAYADFLHRLSGREANAEQVYSINVTTSLIVTSTNRIVNATVRQIDVRMNVLNEGAPALAKQIMIYYRVSGAWVIPNQSDGYSLQDYGNGTYMASFKAMSPTWPVEVSIHTTDCRDIFVRANATSIDT